MRSFASALGSAIHASSFHCVRSLARLADIQAKRLEDAALRTRRAQWKERVGGSAPSSTDHPRPTKLAYRWMGLAGWQPSGIGDIEANDAIPCDPEEDDCQPEDNLLVQHALVASTKAPLADQAAVEKQADEWARLWRAEDTYSTPTFHSSSDQLHALLPYALRMAASSFPLCTGLGGDNIAPRAILRLSDAALTALFCLLTAFEKLGHWVHALDLVLIVLPPKSDGGFRPICLFPTVIRLWMRAHMGCQSMGSSYCYAKPFWWNRHGSTEGIMGGCLHGRARCLGMQRPRSGTP